MLPQPLKQLDGGYSSNTELTVADYSRHGCGVSHKHLKRFWPWLTLSLNTMKGSVNKHSIIV